MINLEDSRIEVILIQLLQDVSWIKSKLDNVDEIKKIQKELGDRVDKIEAMNERHNHELKALENRANAMEQWTRNNLNESNKTTKGVFISAALAVFSAIVSLVINMM